VAIPPLIPLPFLTRGLRRDLLVSAIDAAAFSVMVGCGETYFPAFSLAIGLGPVSAGLMASVPLVAGALVQLVTPLGMARVGSNRAWVIGCTVVQAASFLPFVYWAFVGHAELWQLLIAASVYWSAGMAGAPAWTAWMAALVPVSIRTRYFAVRNALGQFGVFAGFVAGGLMLQFGEARSALLPAFATIFGVACGFRLLSSLCLWSCREPRVAEASPRDGDTAIAARITAALRAMAARPSGVLVVALCAFMFGAHVAGPYFTPYMLRELRFSYAAYMLVFATSFLAKAVVLLLVAVAVGGGASRLGPRRLLWGAGLAITPLALLWLPSPAVPYLCGVQVVAGGCWAVYELAVTLLFFEAIDERERTGVMTVYNLGIAVASVAGAIVGGLLLRGLGEDRTAYFTVFIVSSIVRLAALPLLRRIPLRR
jgi:MFS family permease